MASLPFRHAQLAAIEPGHVRLTGCQGVLRDMGREDLAANFWALAPSFVHEDAEQAGAIPAASWESYRQAFVDHGSPAQADGALPKTYEAYTRWDDFRAYQPENVRDVPSLLVGDPKVLIDKIEAQRALGIDNFILWMNRGGGIDQRDVLHAMDLFANEVMPHFAHVPAH